MDSFGVGYVRKMLMSNQATGINVCAHTFAKIILCTGTWLMNIIEYKSKGVLYQNTSLYKIASVRNLSNYLLSKY